MIKNILLIYIVLLFWLLLLTPNVAPIQENIDTTMFYPTYQTAIIKPTERSSYDVYGIPILLDPVSVSGTIPTVYDIVTKPARRDIPAIRDKALLIDQIVFINREINCLATNMYHEARSEKRIGMVAVGWVTINRRNSNKFPNTICEVVYQRSQFAWVGEGIYRISENEAFQQALDAAKFLYNNENNLTDYTLGAQYFLSYMEHPPSWSRRFTTTFQYRKHTFYRQDN